MDADTFYIDYSESSGAGDQYDDSSPSENDGRSLTRTGFNSRDGDARKRVIRHDKEYEYWEWLSQLNDGLGAEDIESRVRRADARRDAKTYASQLGMTDYQCERVVYLINNLDTLYYSTIPAEGTVLAIISLVANEDGWMIRQTSEDPSDNRGPNVEVTANGETKTVPLFTKIMYEVGMSPQKLRLAREKLRDCL